MGTTLKCSKILVVPVGVTCIPVTLTDRGIDVTLLLISSAFSIGFGFGFGFGSCSSNNSNERRTFTNCGAQYLRASS